MRKQTTKASYPKKDKIHIFFFNGRWRLGRLAYSEPKRKHIKAAIAFCTRLNGDGQVVEVA